MDPLRFAIAAVPLAAYFLLIGLMSSRRRPLLVTGAGDLAALGFALTGVALVGPISLFRPEAATAELGDYVWLFLLALYWLAVTLVVMLCRPRLVVYNLTAEQLRPILSEALRQLDPAGRWAGDSLSLPTLGVQAHLETFTWTRNTSLIASGGRQDLAGWRRLSRSVERSLRDTESRSGSHGAALMGVGAGLLIAAIGQMVADPPAVARAWGQILGF